MVWFFKKKEKEKDYDKIQKATIEKLDLIIKEVDDKNYLDKYSAVKNVFLGFFNGLFKTNTNYTGDEVIKKLHAFNIKHKSIEKLKAIILKIDQIDYYGRFLGKEEVLALADNFRNAVIEICEEKKEAVYEQKKHVFSKDESSVEKKFERELNELKEEFYKSGKIKNSLVLRVKSYFDPLPNKKKERYAGDVHYFCERLPLFFSLLDEAEKFVGDQSEFHNILSQINHLFIKLDDKEKEYVYPRILRLTGSDEEKFNIYLMLAYSYLHQKKLKEANFFYHKLSEHYKALDSKKKEYYYSLIQRFIKKFEAEKDKLEKNTGHV